MLKERPTRQHQGELKRRWFSNDYFDIFVWQYQDAGIAKFQLCYDIRGRERAVTWTQGNGFSHHLIDDGETSPTKNQSPILLADGPFPAREILEKFITSSEVIEQQIRSFIIEKLSHCDDPFCGC